jgi:hypothetical protein
MSTTGFILFVGADGAGFVLFVGADGPGFVLFVGADGANLYGIKTPPFPPTCVGAGDLFRFACVY